MIKGACVAVAVCLLVTPAFGGLKENRHQQLSDLAAEMRQLRAAGDSEGAAYAALRAQYEQLSAALGGARPGWNLPGDTEAEGEAPVGTIGGIPPPLLGCVQSTATFTQSTPTVISATGTPLVTSTVVVAGAGVYLVDVNLRTVLSHTFNADLDFTLQSPAGTIVTLSTDSAGGNDNVFNGTVWDDDANPGTQVPYPNNPGVTSDRAYVNNVVATPMAPEEAMGAFIGQNPNGTWTITIQDQANLDGGSLTSWTLELTTIPAAPTVASTVATQSTPTVISPTGTPLVTSTLVVAGAGTTIVDVDLTTFLAHTFNADLDFTLQSPAGTIVTLSTDSAGGNDNVFNGTVWDDDANPGTQVPYPNNPGVTSDRAYVNNVLATPMVPEEAMGAFTGENPNGTWTITIQDQANLDGGSLTSWTLDIDTATCVQGCSLTCPSNQIDPNDANQCGAVETYPPPTSSGSCGTVTCSPASGSFFPVGTTTVTCSEQQPSGGLASCQFTQTVNDTQAPTVTSPDLVVNTEPGICSATVLFNATVSDNCPGVGAVTCVPPSGSSFPEGVNNVTCSATDAAGNQGSDPGSITVNDIENPVITCPADIELDLPPGSTGQNVDFDPVTSDNCGVDSVDCQPPSGDLFPAGTTPVNCIAYDFSGNSATCAFNVILNGVSVLEVPTMSTVGLAALALLLAGAALLLIRRNG